MLSNLAGLCHKGFLLHSFGFDSCYFMWSSPFTLFLNLTLFKAIKAATDAESDTDHLSGMSVIVLEGIGRCPVLVWSVIQHYKLTDFESFKAGLFCSLTYFFSRNGCHTSDYQLALQRSIKRDRSKSHKIIAFWFTLIELFIIQK